MKKHGIFIALAGVSMIVGAFVMTEKSMDLFLTGVLITIVGLDIMENKRHD